MNRCSEGGGFANSPASNEGAARFGLCCSVRPLLLGSAFVARFGLTNPNCSEGGGLPIPRKQQGAQAMNVSAHVARFGLTNPNRREVRGICQSPASVSSLKLSGQKF